MLFLEQERMVLRETVKDFNADKVRLLIWLCAVVEDLVCFEFIGWDVLREELVVHDTIDNLSFANEAWSEHTDSESLHCLFGASLWFLSHLFVRKFILF